MTQDELPKIPTYGDIYAIAAQTNEREKALAEAEAIAWAALKQANIDPTLDGEARAAIRNIIADIAAFRSSQQPSPQTNELDKVRNLICEYWDADEQANAHKTICDIHDVLLPNNPTIRRKQRAAPAPPRPDPAEEIVRQCEGKLDWKHVELPTEILRALISSWRERGEALEGFIKWSEAYPTDVFVEPDLKKAHAPLQAGGMTLDAVSAHTLRWATKETGKRARAALRSSQQPAPRTNELAEEIARLKEALKHTEAWFANSNRDKPSELFLRNANAALLAADHTQKEPRS